MDQRRASNDTRRTRAISSDRLDLGERHLAKCRDGHLGPVEPAAALKHPKTRSPDAPSPPNSLPVTAVATSRPFTRGRRGRDRLVPLARGHKALHMAAPPTCRNRQAPLRAPGEARGAKPRQSGAREKACGAAAGEPKTRPSGRTARGASPAVPRASRTGARAPRNTRGSTTARLNSEENGGERWPPLCDGDQRRGWSDNGDTSGPNWDHKNQPA